MKMTGARFLSCAAIILPLAARADVSLPSIVVDGMTQASDRAITITYSLENGPAVVAQQDGLLVLGAERDASDQS